MKYLLSSRFSWALKEFFSFDRLPSRCKKTNRTTGADGNEENRVSHFNAALPDCACEACRTSKYSPGPVLTQEILVRFVMHPMHVGKKGELKPSLFSHVELKGCSVQRETWATDAELKHFLDKVCPAGSSKNSWHGVVCASTEQIRKARSAGTNRRNFWVYDTAEKDNPAHAEIGRAISEVRPEDVQELRYQLMKIFSTDAPLDKPDTYRGGNLQ